MMFKFILLKDLRKLIEVSQSVTGIYEIMSEDGERDFDLSVHYAKISKIIVTIMPIMYLNFSLLYQAPFILNYLTSGEFTPPVGISFPGIQALGSIGLIFLFLFNFVISVGDALIVAASDTLIIFTFVNMLMVSSIIAREMMDLKVENSERQLEFKLIQIIMMQKRYFRSVFYSFFRVFNNFHFISNYRDVKKIENGCNNTSICQIATASLFLMLSIFLTRSVSISISVSHHF